VTDGDAGRRAYFRRQPQQKPAQPQHKPATAETSQAFSSSHDQAGPPPDELTPRGKE
jgi:hypothetical protein